MVLNGASNLLYESIVLAAQDELDASGMLGLRILEVSRRANCAVSTIYRLFRDRDELIANALIHRFESQLSRIEEGSTSEHDRADVASRITMFSDPSLFVTRVQLRAAQVSVSNLDGRITELESRLIRLIRRCIDDALSDVGSKSTEDVETLASLISGALLLPEVGALHETQTVAPRFAALGSFGDLAERYLS